MKKLLPCVAEGGNCGGASPPWVNPDLFGQLTKNTARSPLNSEIHS